MVLNRVRRAAGTRTTTDVLMDVLFRSQRKRQLSDVESVLNGERRLVRCYLKPGSGERRLHWKPGSLILSKDEVVWKGSRRKWKRIVLQPGQWKTQTRRVPKEERVYHSFWILDCTGETGTVSFAVPRLDVELCAIAIEGRSL